MLGSGLQELSSMEQRPSPCGSGGEKEEGEDAAHNKEKKTTNELHELAQSQPPKNH